MLNKIFSTEPTWTSQVMQLCLNEVGKKISLVFNSRILTTEVNVGGKDMVNYLRINKQLYKCFGDGKVRGRRDPHVNIRSNAQRDFGMVRQGRVSQISKCAKDR